MSFTILKSGRVIGPLERPEIRRLLASGQISSNDLAQRGNTPFWVPLDRLLPTGALPCPKLGIRAAWRRTAVRLWAALNDQPLSAGLAALALGCLIIVLARWPVLLFGPPILAAVFAAAVLLSQQRFLAGFSLCLSAFLLPVALLFLVNASATLDPPWAFPAGSPSSHGTPPTRAGDTEPTAPAPFFPNGSTAQPPPAIPPKSGSSERPLVQNGIALPRRVPEPVP